MDLKSGYPFWAVKNGLMHAFPQLRSDAQCDVLVIGAGITGALIARQLAADGIDVMVVEQRDVGWGSTAASTALLQYEIDTHMTELARDYGEDAASLAYRSCVDAIHMLQDVAHDTRDVGFRKTESLYLASSQFHEGRLRREFEMRTKHGIDVEFLSRQALREHTGIDAPCALLSRVSAEVDPYRLAMRILEKLEKSGVRIFDRTCIDRVDASAIAITAFTDSGFSIAAKHVVVAAGYAAQKWISRRVARNRSSYAFVTDPLDTQQIAIWSRTLLWESARPYLYMRSTTDNRLLIGGEDDKVDIPARRDARVEKKANTLIKRVHRSLPHLELAPTFAWAGTFAETADGLPFFGAHPERGPRMLFAMAYGGNGITYSMLGAGLISALIRRRTHPLKKLFAFSRIYI